jgi:hypothetical protein
VIRQGIRTLPIPDSTISTREYPNLPTKTASDRRPRTKMRAAYENAGGPLPAGIPVDQKAAVPFGVPRPVGPSQPTRALHHWLVVQVPLEPDVTSNRLVEWVYG